MLCQAGYGVYRCSWEGHVAVKLDWPMFSTQPVQPNQYPSWVARAPLSISGSCGRFTICKWGSKEYNCQCETANCSIMSFIWADPDNLTDLTGV